MLKFFRRIRRTLLSENKFSKYILYAIGEIILVVIGILLALQINNWNERRKVNTLKKDYYNQLIIDLDKEKENINERIFILNSGITSVNTYFNYLDDHDLTPVQIFNALTKVNRDFKYLAFNTNTIESLESTGDIKLIPEEIRNLLMALKRDQERTINVAKGNYEIYLNSIQKAAQLGLYKLYDQDKTNKVLGVENNITDIILIFDAAIGMKNYTDKTIRSLLNKMLNDISNVKELISTELKKE